jgi:predicted  nucleic acid-binding Zn-ribbon protein
LAEKQIKEMKASIEYKKQIVATSSEKLEQKQSHLGHKKSELDAIMSETAKEETFLSEKSAEFEALIEARLLAAYKRIRNSVRNGLAVVSIERGASAGSFFTIPPQTQVEIASRKKIITDEHSGRILVDSTLAEEEKEKMEKLFSKI